MTAAGTHAPVAVGVRPKTEDRPAEKGRCAVRDSLVVTIGGQLQRLLGTVTSLALRWGLDPELLGVYTGLRIYLDNTNRSSLGVGLGAVQEIPILRAAGREAEATRVANLAHTANMLTCLVYALGLLAWAAIRAPLVAHDPLAREWTWGLVAVAGLALIHRHLTFLVAVLRAHQEFTLTTELDVLESVASAVFIVVGLWLAGFWGLLGALGLLMGSKIAYLHLRHPLRFGWAWDLPAVARLMVVGLPILANTAAFGAVQNLDRVLILWLVPDGARAAGLYTIALLGAGWSLDLAGRIVGVMYTYFQTTLGRTGDLARVALLAVRTTEAQVPILAAGSAAAYLIWPETLGLVFPRYADGLPAIRPLLPGVLLLGLSWPARQMLIAIGRPYRLCLATLAGLVLAAEVGAIGAASAGIVGVAAGMSVGFTGVFLLTSATALVPTLGWRAWLAHLARLAATVGWFAAGAILASHAPTIHSNRWLDLAVRTVLLACWTLPHLYRWGRRHGWGGLLRRGVAVEV